jgi:hypothetical protein
LINFSILLKQCTFGDEPHQMLKVFQLFVKHCSCHLQGKFVLEARFRKPYIGQAVGGELNVMVQIGGAEGWAAICCTSHHNHINSPRTEMLDNFQNSMWPTSKRQSFALIPAMKT